MKVAVIGSGVSGLASTWVLNQHSDHEVHLYEADSRPGGHANTVHFKPPGKPSSAEGVDVDTGFIVFNPSTYPNFLRFLKRFPSIKILPTEMTFSVSRDNGLFEWAGNNLFTIFCQPTRLLDPDMWRLIYDVLRFNACARRLVMGTRVVGSPERSIGEYLSRENYSRSFRDNYLIVRVLIYALPMTAAIWSTPVDKCFDDFPAETLIRFMNNHHLLQVTGKPSWLTLQGGSRVYVDSILSQLPKGNLHLSTPVTAVSTKPDGSRQVELTTADGQTSIYDHVIMACHSDTTLSILKAGEGLTADEQDVLGSFSWNQNSAVLHSDVKLLPRRRIAWACWNYLSTSGVDAQGKHKANADTVALWAYWRADSMNILQHIPEKKYGHVLVTLNPPEQPDEKTVVGRYRYEHPVLDAQAIRAQERMHLIQGKRGISFAGAWLRYGFHEDGFTSGMRAVADHIPDIKLPFEIEDPDRDPAPLWIAPAFDAFESSGLRALVGVVLSFVLAILRTVLSYVGFDFSHIEAHVDAKTKMD
ncbi:hypothetical protein PLICRDRAFT_113438 [Plicaturopsis crispa FD-325 SS-3]|nr:hypothetical protein PLICRDRAFT_113438 [Plicaturopsis crispa FD-325 SS-3]